MFINLALTFYLQAYFWDIHRLSGSVPKVVGYCIIFEQESHLKSEFSSKS